MTSLQQAATASAVPFHPRQRHLVTAIVLAALGAACSDGYPTGDITSSNPVEMTAAELLQQLNRIGDQAHLDRRWQYALSAECELTVSTSKRFRGDRKVAILLTDAEISMRAEAPDAYEVLIRPSTASRQELLALEGGTWADGLRMRSLLDFLRRRCG